jgi:hypothetical protein
MNLTERRVIDVRVLRFLPNTHRDMQKKNRVSKKRTKNAERR